MKNAYENHRGFLWIKRKIDYEEGQTLRDMHLEWIGIQKETQRHYPNGALASHVLGSVDFAEAGNAGIERYLDKDLRGVSGTHAPPHRREAPRHRIPVVRRAASGRLHYPHHR